MTEPPRGQRLFRAWAASTPPFDEEAGRARFLETLTAGKPRSGRRLALLAAAVAMACALALGWWRTRPALRFTTASGEGHVGAWLATSKVAEMPLTFSEGTHLVIATDSRGRVEELGRTGATFLLERGEIRGRVVHRSSASFRFIAGPFEVRVTGTTLGVQWDPVRERFAVRVGEGKVAVRGPHVGAPQVVQAGERCVVDLPSGTMRLSSSKGDVSEAPPPPETHEDVVEPPPRLSTPSAIAPRLPLPAPVAPWTTLELRGDYDAAYVAAVTAGLASVLRASSADELLRLAQVGQLSGHRDVERESLLACRRRFPRTEQAAVAAYELGRASLSGEAASWFDAYLRERPAGPLAREALGRLVEARAAAGDTSAARAAAAAYLARYPDGPQAALARRALAGGRE